MDEDDAVEIGRRQHGKGWVAQGYTGEWHWYAWKPTIEGLEKYWTISPSDTFQECYQIGFSDYSEHWEDSLRKVT